MAIKSRTIIAISSETTAEVRSIAQIIAAYDNAEATTLLLDHGKTCAWYGVQNKDAAASLYLQTDNAISGDGNVEILATNYRHMPPDSTKYDLDEDYIRVGTDGQVFSLDIKWG